MVQKKLHPSPVLWGKLRPLAREMRSESTEAEAALWSRLRGRQVLGQKFRRQHAVDRFVTDFCCPEAKLIVELDGGIHDLQKEADCERDQILMDLGYQILRFSNDEVLCQIGTVIERIKQAVRK